MSARIRRHIRSNVIGYLALFVALSGTAYAVDGPLPGQDQVGSADIINNEVQSADIKDANLTTADIRASAVTSGKIADGEVRSADVLDNNLTGADVLDDSLTGDDIQESSLFPTTLPSGKTLRGNYAARDHNTGDTAITREAQSFLFPLASAPTPHWISPSGTPPEECPGTWPNPEADPGHLCVWGVTGAVSGVEITSASNTAGVADKTGFVVAAGGTSSEAWSQGTWAVTAP